MISSHQLNGDVCSCNFTEGYLFGERQDLSLSVSDHVDFLKDRRTWRIGARNDGKPIHAGTFLLNDSATTVSHLVQLGDGS